MVGLFYRWSIDLSGPFHTTTRGNTYIVHMMEHSIRLMVLTAIPSKEAKHTAFAFEQCVLGHFGGCAEVLSDQGTEFLGEFEAMLSRNFIDHRTTAPGHPQANGLAERCVGTIKRCLRRHCEDVERIDTWDQQLPYLSLGYNCSRQSSTNCSPFQLLYARAPNIPSAVLDRMVAPLDFDSPDAIAATLDQLLIRAAYIAQAMPTVASNLAIAQHRDSLRYLKTRNGTYLPKLRKFSKGDYVYLQRPKVVNTMQIPARMIILRIMEIKPNGAVTLQGRCGCTITNNIVNIAPCHLPNINGTLFPELARPTADLGCEVCNFPDDESLMLLCDSCGTGWHTYCLTPALDSIPAGDWICPNCNAAGITLTSVSTARHQLNSTTSTSRNDNLFADASTRTRDRQAAAYDGRIVVKKIPSTHGNVLPVFGTASFLGADKRPMYFLVRYDDATEETLSLKGLKNRHPLPAGTSRPVTPLLHLQPQGPQYTLCIRHAAHRLYGN
jgi:hypothetical protein